MEILNNIPAGVWAFLGVLIGSGLGLLGSIYTFRRGVKKLDAEAKKEDATAGSQYLKLLQETKAWYAERETELLDRIERERQEKDAEIEKRIKSLEDCQQEREVLLIENTALRSENQDLTARVVLLETEVADLKSRIDTGPLNGGE
jgi:hypothetical protein